jgi:hypothetical protein
MKVRASFATLSSTAVFSILLASCAQAAVPVPHSVEAGGAPVSGSEVVPIDIPVPPGLDLVDVATNAAGLALLVGNANDEPVVLRFDGKTFAREELPSIAAPRGARLKQLKLIAVALRPDGTALVGASATFAPESAPKEAYQAPVFLRRSAMAAWAVFETKLPLEGSFEIRDVACDESIGCRALVNRGLVACIDLKSSQTVLSVGTSVELRYDEFVPRSPPCLDPRKLLLDGRADAAKEVAFGSRDERAAIAVAIGGHHTSLDAPLEPRAAAPFRHGVFFAGGATGERTRATAAIWDGRSPELALEPIVTADGPELVQDVVGIGPEELYVISRTSRGPAGDLPRVHRRTASGWSTIELPTLAHPAALLSAARFGDSVLAVGSEIVGFGRGGDSAPLVMRIRPGRPVSPPGGALDGGSVDAGSSSCVAPRDCFGQAWGIRCAGHYACMGGACRKECDFERCGDGTCDEALGEDTQSCAKDCRR